MHRCYGDPSIAERFRTSIDIFVAGDPAGVFFSELFLVGRGDEVAQGKADARGQA
jgi:hypothetical protein